MSRTVTIDTQEMQYTGQGGNKSYVDNGETFTIVPSGSGTPRRYTISSTTPLKMGAHKIYFDNTMSSFQANANATATINAGSLWIEEMAGHKVEWKIRSVTIDNVATPTEITNMVLERCDNTMITMTLSGITVGA